MRTTAEPGPIDYTAPNKFGEEITPGEQITSVGQALADAQPEQTDEPYPLVVFSHGFALSPIVYSTMHRRAMSFLLPNTTRALTDHSPDSGRS
jgi:Platelet-activating factor acetylhydrolase, isoform II